jgi:hypothetical protein
MAQQNESRQTRPGRVFWGTAFLVVGALLLVDHFGILSIAWESAWKFWPLVLILLGVSLLLGSKPLRIIALVLAAVFAGLLFYSMSTTFWDVHRWGERGGWVEREFKEPLNGTLDRASLIFESGAGSFTLADTCGTLFEAATRSVLGTYAVDRDHIDGRERVRLHLEKKPFVWGFGPGRNIVDMRVNGGPVWDVTFNIGAAHLEFDGTPIKVDRVIVNAGAADINMRLGSRAGESRVKINCGASKVRIAVPASAGCRLRVDAPLSSKHFGEFQKDADGTYRTDNFNEAAVRIDIDIDAGVSSLKIDRY